MKGAEPVGTLECPDGYILDENLNMCVPESPLIQASHGITNFTRLSDVPKELQPKKPKKKKTEKAAPFKPTAKMERCIRDVKANLTKRNPKFKDQNVKSAAIAICRSRLKS